MTQEQLDEIINTLHGAGAFQESVYTPPVLSKYPQYNRPDEGPMFELVCSPEVGEHLMRLNRKGVYRKKSRGRPMRMRA